MKPLIRICQALLITLAMSCAFFSIPGTISPAVAYDCQSLPYGPRTNGIVTRIDVADFEASKEFYGDVLGMTCIKNFDAPPYWAEFYNGVDPQAHASIGLSNTFGSPETRTVTTKIVRDLASACDNLYYADVPITSSEYVGSGVCLVRFQDPNGNELAYRQEKWGGFDAENPDEELLIAEECQEIIDNFCF